MKQLLHTAALVACTFASGCGTYIPSTRDITSTDSDEVEMIEEISRTINCELSHTVTRIIDLDDFDSRRGGGGRTYASFLKEWGVQVALNMTVYERTNFNPTVLVTPPPTPSVITTLAGGGTLNGEAYRLQKINFFYTVQDLYRPRFFKEAEYNIEACRNPARYKAGSPLVDSDLRLFSLIKGRISSTALGFSRGPESPVLSSGEKNALSQTVSFKVTASGQFNPSFKLTRAGLNPSGNLFSTGRDRTHELVFTFGPLDKSLAGRSALAPLAQQIHLDTQLQTGIRNSLISP
ncbi:hypothetical protein [Methylobacterium sp. Leaf89]|uniref:hypothetical protein n=1 Tax=Methylobacterium sp. Leaf89 TaxID=1736245 RepID=UPI000B0C17F0|nr:hypothetical protein [Methylobacterium sp. Leaf89]